MKAWLPTDRQQRDRNHFLYQTNSALRPAASQLPHQKLVTKRESTMILPAVERVDSADAVVRPLGHHIGFHGRVGRCLDPAQGAILPVYGVRGTGHGQDCVKRSSKINIHVCTTLHHHTMHQHFKIEARVCLYAVRTCPPLPRIETFQTFHVIDAGACLAYSCHYLQTTLMQGDFNANNRHY